MKIKIIHCNFSLLMQWFVSFIKLRPSRFFRKKWQVGPISEFKTIQTIRFYLIALPCQMLRRLFKLLGNLQFHEKKIDHPTHLVWLRYYKCYLLIIFLKSKLTVFRIDLLCLPLSNLNHQNHLERIVKISSKK